MIVIFFYKFLFVKLFTFFIFNFNIENSFRILNFRKIQSQFLNINIIFEKLKQYFYFSKNKSKEENLFKNHYIINQYIMIFYCNYMLIK